MMTRSQRRLVWGLIVALFACGGLVSEVLTPGHNEYMRAGLAKEQEMVDPTDPTGARSALKGSTFQTLMPTLLGIREVLASLMWVQADDYFHRGEYRPILAMVHQITAIDPHQIDVYATGAWHMAYNFMDKRLIEDGVKFLEEGSNNNRTVYDLYFELGYMHYDKTKDFGKAAENYRISSTRGTTIPGKKEAPSYVTHQLAHALEKMGDIDQCVAQWQKNLEHERQQEANGEKAMTAAGPNTAAAKHNLYITERRRSERMAAVAERERNAAEAARLWARNVALADAWLANEPTHPEIRKDRDAAQANVDRLRAGKLAPTAPTDVALQFKVTRVAPRKLEVEGTCNVLNLSRVNLRFQDKDYQARSRTFDAKMNDCTLEWDNAPVKQGKFEHLLDLDRDPADMERQPSEIYPLHAQEYELTVSFNPRLQAAFIQDLYGWNGEGITAAPDMLKVDAAHPGVMDGKRTPLRYVAKTIILKRADVVGAGKKQLYP